MDTFNNYYWAEWKIGKLRGHTPTCKWNWHEAMTTKSYFCSTQFLCNHTLAKVGSFATSSASRCVLSFYNSLLSPEFHALKVNSVVGCVWWHCALLRHSFRQTLQTEDKKRLFLQTNAANLVAAGFLIPVFSLDLGFIAFCFLGVFFHFSQCVVCSSLAKSMKPSWFCLRISPECVWCEFLSNRHFCISSLSLYVLVSLMFLPFLQIYGEVSGRTTWRWRWKPVWLNGSLMEPFLRQTVTVAIYFFFTLMSHGKVIIMLRCLFLLKLGINECASSYFISSPQ